MTNIHSERIEALRALMRSRGWDAVIVGGSDPHQSEYPADRWKQVRWLTGFTGEAGDVVVTLDHCGLWTDTRYFIQAREQLEGSGAVLHKTRVPEEVLIPEWLRMEFDSDAVVALDSLCQSAEAVDELRADFNVVGVPDLLGVLWEDRPTIPQTPIFRVRAGESRADKLCWLRETMREAGCEAVFLSALDEIAWLLNIRASDIEYNPMCISYLLVCEDSASWFVLKEEVEDPQSQESFDALAEDGVEILPYGDVALVLSQLDDIRLWLDSSTINAELRDCVRCPVLLRPSPVAARKEVKNEAEIAWLRECHVRDGVAMEKFLYWLDRSMAAGKRISEWDAAVKLGQYRAEIEDYMGDSFETISAYGKGAALPHYVTPKENAPLLEAHGLYLCDSGGQFLSGTTDITRTVPLGECTDEEIRDYTLVLKGHVDLAMAVFPAGTPGCRIDAAARMPLWRNLMNYGHGTGHGVGFFLGVHEGPHQIRQNLGPEPLLEGMVTSDEPGIYREGRHGVRHENLLLTVNAGSSEFGSFLAFETLTLCHFDTSAIDVSLLDKDEIEWINAYNRRVFLTLGPLLDKEIAQWLEAKTAPLVLE